MTVSRVTQLKEGIRRGSWLSRCLSVSRRAILTSWRRRPGKIISINAPPFEVQNLHDEKFDETEALTTFAVAVAAVAREYHVNYVLRPGFVLVLGSGRDDISWPQGKEWTGGEIRMQHWDKRLFRASVIALTIHELTKPRNVLRLEREIEHRERATVEVKRLQL